MPYIITILLLAVILLAYTAFKQYMSALILSAWMAEKEYAPPEKEDIERLSKWVVQKWLEDRN